MTDGSEGPGGHGGTEDRREAAPEERAADTGDGTGGRRPFSNGMRQVNAVLSAVKEALEESVQDARERGDLSKERARELVQGAVNRAREAAGGARERLDFAMQRDLEELSAQVSELRGRLEALERQAERGPGGGERAGG